MIPTRGRVWYGTMNAVCKLLAEHAQHPANVTLQVQLLHGKRGVLEVVRDMYRAFLDSGDEILLQMGDDNIPNDQILTLVPMVRDHQYDILASPCPIVQGNGVVMPNLYRRKQDGWYQIDLQTAMLQGHHRYDAVGTGVCLLHRRVIEKLGDPAFRYDINGDLWMGEDIDYCDRASKAGFIVGAHNDFASEHLMELHGNTIALAYHRFYMTEDAP